MRIVRAEPIREPPSPRVIGIDEWAWRRGRRYGTIIVDLERNRIVDLLSSREVDPVAAWLRQHPGVAVVARDRAEVYGEAIRQGAPGATQVLDRWHLLRNLSDALQDAIRRSHAVTRAVAAQISSELAAAYLAEQAASRPASATERRKAAWPGSRAGWAWIARPYASG